MGEKASDLRQLEQGAFDLEEVLRDEFSEQFGADTEASTATAAKDAPTPLRDQYRLMETVRVCMPRPDGPARYVLIGTWRLSRSDA